MRDADSKFEARRQGEKRRHFEFPAHDSRRCGGGDRVDLIAFKCDLLSDFIVSFATFWPHGALKVSEWVNAALFFTN